MNEMTYKGYIARIEYDSNDRCFFGHVQGIKDIIDFDGKSVEELEAAFHQIIDFYMESCREIGKEPERSQSGMLVVKLPESLYEEISLESEKLGKSAAAIVVDALKKTRFSSGKNKKLPRRKALVE